MNFVRHTKRVYGPVEIDLQGDQVWEDCGLYKRLYIQVY